MILRTLQKQHADDEKELRTWLQQNIGVEDAETLAAFVWENEQREGPVAYLSGLAQIVKGAAMMGKPFVGNLIDMAKKPKEVRDAEMELAHFAAELLPRLVSRIRRYAGAPEVVKAALDELVTQTRERIEKMWPGRPDYIVNSAVACGVIHKDEKLSIDVGAITKCILQPDVLAPYSGRA